MRYIPMRIALTPEQKRLRREQQLAEALRDNEMPDFDEAFEAIREFGEIGAKYDEAVYELEYENAYLDVEERLDDDEIAEAAEERVRDDAEHIYNEAERQLLRLDGKSCYRAIALREGADPTRLDSLGVFWAYRAEGAGLYDAEADYEAYPLRATFKADIDLAYVDLRETFLNNMIYGGREYEVTWLRHAPIYVHGVWVTPRDHYVDTRDKSTMILINDWRRT